MQQRRDTGANWAAANPVLADGEIGVNTDNGAIRIGNGFTGWTGLRQFLPGPVDYAEAVRTAGDISLSASGWQTLTTTADLVLAAAAGDLVMVTPNFNVGATNNALAFDVGTFNGAVPINTFSGGATNGLTGWYCPASVTTGVSGGVHYRVVSGDIIGGVVTMRIRVNPATATVRSVGASAASPLRLQAINLGQLL